MILVEWVKRHNYKRGIHTKMKFCCRRLEYTTEGDTHMIAEQIINILDDKIQTVNSTNGTVILVGPINLPVELDGRTHLFQMVLLDALQGLGQERRRV